MLLISVDEFEINIEKYLELALTERVAIQSEYGVFEIIPQSDTD